MSSDVGADVHRGGAPALVATGDAPHPAATADTLLDGSAVYTPQLPPAAAAAKPASPMGCALHSESARATVNGRGASAAAHDADLPSPIPLAWCASEVATLRRCVHRLVANPRPLDAALLSFLLMLPGRTLAELCDRWLQLRRSEDLKCPPAAQLEAAVRSAAAKAAPLREETGTGAAGAEAAGTEAAGTEAPATADTEEAAGGEEVMRREVTGMAVTAEGTPEASSSSSSSSASSSSAAVAAAAAASAVTTAAAEVASPAALGRGLAAALDGASRAEGSPFSAALFSASPASSRASSSLASPPVRLITAPQSVLTFRPKAAPAAAPAAAAPAAAADGGRRPSPPSSLAVASESVAIAGTAEDSTVMGAFASAAARAAQHAIAIASSASPALPLEASPSLNPPPAAPASPAVAQEVATPAVAVAGDAAASRKLGGGSLGAPFTVVAPAEAQRGQLVRLQLEPSPDGAGGATQTADATMDEGAATADGAAEQASSADAAADPAAKHSASGQQPPSPDQEEAFELTAVVPAGTAPGGTFEVFLPPSDRRGRFEARNDEVRGGGKEAGGKEAGGKEAGAAKGGGKGNFWHRCGYPGCGKMYRNTDAARKHCRQLHSAWLGQIGAGSPSAYCTLIQFAERRPCAPPSHSRLQPPPHAHAPGSAHGVARGVALAVAPTAAAVGRLKQTPSSLRDASPAAGRATAEAAAAATPLVGTGGSHAVDDASTALAMMPAESPAGLRLVPPPPLRLVDSLEGGRPSSAQLLAASLTTPVCTQYEKTLAGARRARSPERGGWLRSDESVLSRPQPKRATLPPYMPARAPLAAVAMDATSPAAPLSAVATSDTPSPVAAATATRAAPTAPDSAAADDFFDAVRRWASL